MKRVMLPKSKEKTNTEDTLQYNRRNTQKYLPYPKFLETLGSA